MKNYPDLAYMARVGSVSASDYCNVDLHTLMHKIDYSEFVQIENYVDFCADRQRWYDLGAKEEQKKLDALNKATRR